MHSARRQAAWRRENGDYMVAVERHHRTRPPHARPAAAGRPPRRMRRRQTPRKFHQLKHSVAAAVRLFTIRHVDAGFPPAASTQSPLPRPAGARYEQAGHDVVRHERRPPRRRRHMTIRNRRPSGKVGESTPKACRRRSSAKASAGEASYEMMVANAVRGREGYICLQYTEMEGKGAIWKAIFMLFVMLYMP